MPDQTKPANPSESAAPMPLKPVKFIHRQGDHLPTYHADGAWGAVNHHGLIRISFYTENPPVPKSVIQQVNLNGNAKGEPKLEGVDDPEHFLYVRDFQCNVVVPLTSAVQIYQMLGNFIKIAQEQMREQLKAMQSQLKEAAEKKPVQ